MTKNRGLLAFVGCSILVVSLVLSLSFTGFGTAQAQDDGTPGVPAGATPFSVWATVHAEGTNYNNAFLYEVPKDKIAVLQDVNVDACTDVLKVPGALALANRTQGDDMTANLTFWPEGYEATPGMRVDPHKVPKIKIMLEAQGIFDNMIHFGAAQEVTVYAGPGQLIWAEIYRTVARGHAEGRVWVNGYLMPAVPMTREGW